MEIAKKNYHNGGAMMPPMGPRLGFSRPEQGVVNLINDYEDGESLDPAAEILDAGLPILATGNDVREVVRFLKSRPAGITINEAMSAEPRRIFDARKIAAYEFWGILERENELLMLSELGRELARKIEPECEIYQRILRSIPIYSGALESFYKQNLKLVTRLDVANYWKHSQLKLNYPPAHDEKNVEAIAVSFFSICHAAGIGTMTVGKRGQPARLRIDPVRLREFFKGEKEFRFAAPDLPFEAEKTERSFSGINGTLPAAPSRRVYLAAPAENEKAALQNLQTALELADFEDVVFRPAAAADENFLSAAQLSEIRQSSAAVFLFDAGDCVLGPTGERELRSIRLAEISVAQALLNGRVVILWSGGESEAPPAGLQQMDLPFFPCENFDWESGARLVKLLKNFRFENSEGR